MKCKREECLNPAARGQVYCSAACAPLSRISSKGPSEKEVKARLQSNPSGMVRRKHLSEQEIKNFQRRAKHVATALGYPELAEDFAQEIFSAFGSGRTATLDQLFIDFLRSEFGNMRNPSGRARAIARAHTISLDAPASADHTSVLNHELISIPGIGHDAEADLERFSALFRGAESDVFELMFLQGLSQKEIGGRFGLSGSRICQIANIVRRKITDAFALEQVRESFDDDVHAAQLEVSWITL